MSNKNSFTTVSITTQEIDKNKLSKLRLAFKNKDYLIKTLVSHSGLTNKDNIVHLKEISEILRNIYSYPKELKVYRGIGIAWSFQNTLNIKNKGKDLKIGDKVIYESNKDVISFTTEIGIARAFGNLIVETTLNETLDFIIYTNELCVMYNEYQNLTKLETQREVILLAPFEVELKVTEKKTSSWLDW